MDNKEWTAKELAKHRKDEIEAVRRVMKAQEEVAKANAKLAAAKEWLAEVRDGISKFEYQMEYLKKYRRLR
jgi:hypothetical protein